MSKTLQQYQAAPCPQAGGGVHGWVLSTANRAARAGVSQAEAERDILNAMSRPPSPSGEVRVAVAKAYREHVPGGGGVPYPHKPKPRPLPLTREHFIRKGDGAAEVDWWERSPVRIDWEPGPRDMVEVLKALWMPEEMLFLGDRQGSIVAPAHALIRRYRTAPVPPHLILNPMSGREHLTKDGRPSMRCDEAVSVFRYAVAEFDDMSREAQHQFWAGFTSAPVAALVDSGGKSIHGWLRVDCPNREAWERDVDHGLFERVLIPLGCDAACKNESRLSRAPGHYRSEKNSWQRLLYLDPKGGAR